MGPALWAPRAPFLLLAFMARQELKKRRGLGLRSLEAGRSLWFLSQVSKAERQGFLSVWGLVGESEACGFGPRNTSWWWDSLEVAAHTALDTCQKMACDITTLMQALVDVIVTTRRI